MNENRLLRYSLLGVFLFWIGYAAAVIVLPAAWPKGTFGDAFGALNTLFSGLAFAILIATIYLQKQELGLQREEMRLQREEMQQSRAELAGQRQQLERQNELTVLSTRLAVLPTLIAQERASILAMDDGLTEKLRRAEEVEQTLEVLQLELQTKLAQLQEQEVDWRDFPHKRTPAGTQKERLLQNTRQRIQKLEFLIPRMTQLHIYFQDMKSIYDRARQA